MNQSQKEIEALKDELLNKRGITLSAYEAYDIASKMYQNQYLYDIRNILNEKEEDRKQKERDRESKRYQKLEDDSATFGDMISGFKKK